MSLIFPQPLNTVALADIYPASCRARIPWPAAVEPILFAQLDDPVRCGRTSRTRAYIMKAPDEAVLADVYRGDVVRVECEPCRAYLNAPLRPHCRVGDHEPLHAAFYALPRRVVAYIAGGELGEYAEHRLRIHLAGGRQVIKRIEISVSEY